jgi:hypothetical protein
LERGKPRVYPELFLLQLYERFLDFNLRASRSRIPRYGGLGGLVLQDSDEILGVVFPDSGLGRLCFEDFEEILEKKFPTWSFRQFWTGRSNFKVQKPVKKAGKGKAPGRAGVKGAALFG